MLKKRDFLVGTLVIFTILYSSFVFAGCCQGSGGCIRAFTESYCDAYSTFTSQECEDVRECDVVACCHDLERLGTAQYRVTCNAINEEHKTGMHFIQQYVMNLESMESLAQTYCADTGLHDCPYTSCEQENSAGCRCGSTTTSDSNPFCCSLDSSVFGSFGECTVSPSCGASDFFVIRGRVVVPYSEGTLDEDKEGVPAANIEAAGKTAITDADGYFTISLVPDGSSGAVVVSKEGSRASATYIITGRDYEVEIQLTYTPPVAETVEVCGNSIDDDHDQFDWADATVDKCDPDCNDFYLSERQSSLAGTIPSGVTPGLVNTVTQAYYTSRGEFYNDGSRDVDLCSDRLDNDCNGLTDCDDPACASSNFCQVTYCGDGITSFPNSMGVYEQCDYYDESGSPLVDESGEPVGDQRLCPGSCIRPGQPNECTCAYSATCGNGIVDEPFEDCDGTFSAPSDRWLASGYSGECTIEDCGKPGSLNPCRCPPPEVCGDGIRQGPEECDVNTRNPSVRDDSSCPGSCQANCLCPPAEATCGNNIIEYGEDCDGTLSLAEDAWETFKHRKFGCERDECVIPGFEEDGEIACSCPVSCIEHPPNPVLDPINVVPFEKEAILSWDDTCIEDNARAYNIHRCYSSNPNDCAIDEDTELLPSLYSQINEEPWPLSPSFVDTTFEPSTLDNELYVCYVVEGLYDTLGDIPPVYSNYQCVYAGREECFALKEYREWATEFCSTNIRSTCNATNHVVPVNEVIETTDIVDCSAASEGRDGEFVCVGPYQEYHSKAGLTECVPLSICEYCNDPFGLFGYSNSDPSSNPGILMDPFGRSRDYGRAPDSEPGSNNDKQTRFYYTACFDLPVCYMDISKTTVDKFYSTVEKDSCYDYNSYQACRKYNETASTCTWQWHPKYKELGIGVCSSIVEDEQECQKCHDPNNKVYGRCDRDICALYGRCYYDQASTSSEAASFAEVSFIDIDAGRYAVEADDLNGVMFQCRHEREISCESYDNEEDCVASASPFSINGAEVPEVPIGVEVSTEGNFIAKDVYEKTGITNDITNPSDDFFGFGKCQWISDLTREEYELIPGADPDLDESYTLVSSEPDYVNRCVKNSDGSPEFVDERFGSYGKNLVYSYISDCGDYLPLDHFINPDILPNLTKCQKDFTNPVSVIPHYVSVEDPFRVSATFEFPVIVEDNSIGYTSSLDYPDTFACLSKTEGGCYPTVKADYVSRDEGNNIVSEDLIPTLDYFDEEEHEAGEFIFEQGLHYIHYFSEDISKNLEVVRNFPIYIDPYPPNVVVEFSNTSYETYEDIWRTNLTISLTITPREGVPGDEDFAICSAKLYFGGSPVYPLQDIIDEYSDSWSKPYNGLVDETYTYWYRCVDETGNVAEENITFVVDGDKSITNPLPTGTVNTLTNDLSVNTGTNAECYYRFADEDIPDFESDRSDSSILSSMTKFEVTGSVDDPRTSHIARVTASSPGFQRYYVKCLMINEGVVKGNGGDEIRFAIDRTPPVTRYTVDRSPYNGWYNGDIEISLECGDPALMGKGLDWSFGCDSTYYCVGRDCADFDDWERYETSIPLTETQYISFYSVDIGENSEVTNSNVLFLIDKVPPNITIEIFEGSDPASVLVMNRLYNIVVTSSKPFISPAVLRPTLDYSTAPARFADGIELLPTLQPNMWKGEFFLPFESANKNFEGMATFVARGSDYHNVSGSGYTEIYVDTKAPPAPVLEPSLDSPSPQSSDYQDIGYPVYYHNGTYYTRDSTLFVTGYTEELLDMIAVTTVDGVDNEIIFTQTETLIEHEDEALIGFEGTHEIKVFGDLTRTLDTNMFVGFDEEETTIGPLRQYKSYGHFYDVVGIEYFGGDSEYTSIMVYEELEEPIPETRSLQFYDEQNPSNWFGFHLPTTAFKKTTFYLKSYDEAGNLVRYPKITNELPVLTFFSDPIAPQVLSHFPRDGSTSLRDHTVGVTVKETKKESGLDLSSVEFKINDLDYEFEIVHNEEREAEDPSSYYYNIQTVLTGLPEGDYEISINGLDFARNEFDESLATSNWQFTVDYNVPRSPEFRLDGGFVGPDDRWYVRSSPDFVVDFSAEPNDVILTDVFMNSAPTESAVATCTIADRNIFDCSFNEPKTSGEGFWADYGVHFKAIKILDDGSFSDEGNYGPFWFTVDDQAPDFTPMVQPRFRDNINLTIEAVVINERHPLKANLEIRGAEYTPLFTSNNGSFYVFVWEVPDYDVEGDEPMIITLTDFAENSNSVTMPVYIDLTAPRMENVRIEVSDTVLIHGERFTSQPVATITGNFVEGDIERVWVMPGNYNETTGVTDNRTYGEVIYDESGNSVGFRVTVSLPDPNTGREDLSSFVYNEMLISYINNLKVFARDYAGHERSIDVRVIRDVAGPARPTFCVGSDWTRCTI